MRGPNLPVDVIVPRERPRRWQALVIRRLQAEGHDVAVLHDPAAQSWPTAATVLLGLERTLLRKPDGGLAATLERIPQEPRRRTPALRLDLAGNVARGDVPTIALRFNGAAGDFSAAAMVAAGGLVDLQAVLDGKTVVGEALPMIDRREATSLGIDDVFARAATLLVATVRAFAEGRLVDLGKPVAEGGESGFTGAYLTRALPRLGREAFRRARFRYAHWKVGYRFHAGPGAAETGRLGTGWRVLPEAAGRFYADPFAFHREGQAFIFVEDFDYAAGKAAISVVPFNADGTPQPARIVLEEPYHLSYPQVFERDGAIWMLPEASAGGKLVLYRAESFPDRWRAEAVLLEGEISDATLLDHGGRLWLFATHRDGFGSTSDTLAVFSAAALTGPWRPHALNPVLIDRQRARPGGAFIRTGLGGLCLPVQDGTLGYGGGLGLSDLLALDDGTVRMAAPRPILAEGDWPFPRIHTLNRSGPLEVIDGIAAVPRRG